MKLNALKCALTIGLTVMSAGGCLPATAQVSQSEPAPQMLGRTGAIVIKVPSYDLAWKLMQDAAANHGGEMSLPGEATASVATRTD